MTRALQPRNVRVMGEATEVFHTILRGTSGERYRRAGRRSRLGEATRTAMDIPLASAIVYLVPGVGINIPHTDIKVAVEHT